jgi:hypothetical protein
MENANAVNPTPEAAPAPAEPATQAPAAEASPAPAETVVSTTPEPTFDEATQKYLENQNIKGTPNEIVAELVKRNQQLRNQPKAEAVQDVLKQEPAKTEAPAPAAPHVLSDMDIWNAQLIVERECPDVKVDANFYKEMISNGWNPMNGNEIAINRVLEYAGQKQKLIEAEKAIAAANQPASIPSPSNTIDDNSPIQQVQQMDRTAAENIIVWSAQQERYGKAPHPQLQQAKDFLQGEARKK